MTKLGEKVPTRVACLPDGGWGAGGVRRVFTARIYYWLAVWVLLKLSAKHRCKSFRILYAGKGACGMSKLRSK
jgi:hypothetical protein